MRRRCRSRLLRHRRCEKFLRHWRHITILSTIKFSNTPKLENQILEATLAYSCEEEGRPLKHSKKGIQLTK